VSRELQNFDLLKPKTQKVINQNSSAKNLLNVFSSAINFGNIEGFFINIID
jgi:hypothetical protein